MNRSACSVDRPIPHFQGEVIRLARWRRSITQQELAAATGLAQSTISRLESGKDRDPPCSAFMSLATCLDLWHVAFLPWGVLTPPSPHLAKVHAVLSGCLATHFLHHQGNMLRCLHFCLRDAMGLRPDLCGLEVLMLKEEPVARFGAMASRHLEIVTRENIGGPPPDFEVDRDHWHRGRPYWRSERDSGAGEGFYEPLFLIDFPVEWGLVRWGFCAERQTENREQTLHWVGAASRTLERGIDVYMARRGADAAEPDLAARVARLEQLVAEGRAAPAVT